MSDLNLNIYLFLEGHYNYSCLVFYSKDNSPMEQASPVNP